MLDELDELVKKVIELIEDKKYVLVKKEFADMNEADIAEVLEELQEELPTQEFIRVFRLLPKDIAADVFAHLPVEIEQYIINSLTDKETTNIIENMFADDAADLMEEMPASVVRRILALASDETRNDINHLLKYPEDSAGSIMTVEFADLKENITVKQALERIRKIGIDKETINTCYVLDLQRHLVGSVTLRTLLLGNPDAIVSDIMDENVITVSTLDDQETVARQFQKYDFMAMPVVDSENRLVGIITVDDILEIIEEEATEDMEKMAAILPSDKSYFRTGIFETFKSRIPWLLILMISATITGTIIDSFEAKLAGITGLVAFIPMLMDTGGNSGGQASVTIIRAISLNEVEFKDIFKVIWKEIRVAVLCGLTLAVVNFIRVLIMNALGTGITHEAIMVNITVCITLCITVMCAKLVGCMLPILANQLGFDPAVMASPFITTIVDAISLVLFLKIATFMLM
ncbi:MULTISPECIES: magnesium transporter [Eubacterium]|jgi:magnesium transporter|uniref:Magnesium transporter MgtE n=1 Tax=Eubacterium album TaxID=2978477 RepID=A0ABT2LXQ5_9FIRM|nr:MULTISPECIES: magnesium transporter [unclassified Eubacterium (in: firmicutes)]MCT7398080.1 magnesium transporter [Eubacterium sp. LFL-14]RGG67315.1 magnesium transporter [Eubacterium sp. AF17-7]RHR37144.1 magnesium transporter [Eubacterium sp. AF19-12LB]